MKNKLVCKEIKKKKGPSIRQMTVGLAEGGLPEYMRLIAAHRQMSWGHKCRKEEKVKTKGKLAVNVVARRSGADLNSAPNRLARLCVTEIIIRAPLSCPIHFLKKEINHQKKKKMRREVNKKK